MAVMKAVAPRGSAPKTAAKQPAAKQISAMNEAGEVMLARLSSGTGGNARPAGAATAIVAVVVTSYLLWGQGLSPSCCCLGCWSLLCVGVGAHLDCCQDPFSATM